MRKIDRIKQEVKLEKLERTAGIEPALSAWKAGVIPLYDVRALTRLLANQ
jgi:hypothetical protein